MIFVNLPTSDLAASRAFYEAVGFTHNPQFSDDTGICMVLSDTIYTMLLTHDKWRSFTSKPIPDAHATAQVMLAINYDSRAEVDAVTQAAGKAGGKADPNPVQDHGFMYGRDFEDPDGHIWEAFWMDMEAAQAAAEQA
jgi:predicted lactoylglutathione lyase